MFVEIIEDNSVALVWARTFTHVNLLLTLTVLLKQTNKKNAKKQTNTQSTSSVTQSLHIDSNCCCIWSLSNRFQDQPAPKDFHVRSVSADPATDPGGKNTPYFNSWCMKQAHSQPLCFSALFECHCWFNTRYKLLI